MHVVQSCLPHLVPSQRVESGNFDLRELPILSTILILKPRLGVSLLISSFILDINSPSSVFSTKKTDLVGSMSTCSCPFLSFLIFPLEVAALSFLPPFLLNQLLFSRSLLLSLVYLLFAAVDLRGLPSFSLLLLLPSYPLILFTIPA